MGKRNIDRLRDKKDENVADFLVELFDNMGIPLPYTLCKRCVGRTHCNVGRYPGRCPYTEKDFILEWLYSEKRGLYGRM